MLTAILITTLSAFTFYKKKKPKLPDEYIYVVGGTMSAGPENNEVYDMGTPRRISVPGFYMSKYEISNQQYREFVTEISPGLSAEELEILTVDSLGWLQPYRYQEPPLVRYFRHPVFNNYPVVNIRYEAAVRYCKWLQEKIQTDNPDFIINVHLPAYWQWVWAAKSLNYNKYTWGSNSLRDEKGYYWCNYKHIDESKVIKDTITGKPIIDTDTSWKQNGGFYTMPVNSFKPNSFKLYNLCGNVAEMIIDKGTAMGGSWNDYGGEVTATSAAKYDRPVPTVGFRPAIQVKKKEK
jgi:formylglycine-generating enzyme required for sulfatase activity